ncbi:hypothetical protein BX616_005989 [Lobosporangium transversale]|uniref:Uncharacterized protein n=1 Tax=Lobosporangium transversale TaxID=64571 RepID=A0A1Y2GKV3_9FUNG|nr:hypothetical protein BCR41DRAFT_356364 [Lobosporangium transversale]KAF9897215.1 hypothetical protein BX616_005989 [Lobosporangium transversale]ORZ12596.1 hypothetical protein BCR41DRAFT_356364 [Lobosporangium transversale]|eukprot:XP_021880215.1 hypothetical protein BCR41DRAFT_356364 [Lobosporangium transversale]
MTKITNALACFLALSICTTTTSLPIGNPRSSPQSKSVDSTSTSGSPSNTPFHTISRPITIKVDLNTEDPSPLARLVEKVEQQEQYYRQQRLHPRQTPQGEEFARLQKEQDELEKVEQDRDQLLDNQEEEQLDQDPEAVRRRQEESMGLWMTDSEFETLNQEEPSNDESANTDSHESILLNKGAHFDLYAEDLQEVPLEEQNENQPSISRARSLIVESEQPTEEEMLAWPIVNLSQFEDRQDEVQDEYDDQAY